MKPSSTSLVSSGLPSASTELKLGPKVYASVTVHGPRGDQSMILNPNGYAGVHTSEAKGYTLNVKIEGVDGKNFFFRKKKDKTIKIFGSQVSQEVKVQQVRAQVARGGNKSYLDPETNHVYYTMVMPGMGVIVVCVALLMQNGGELYVVSNTTYMAEAFYKVTSDRRVVRFPALDNEHGGLPALANELRVRKAFSPDDESLAHVDTYVPAEPDFSVLKGPNDILVHLVSLRQGQATGYVMRDGKPIAVTVRFDKVNLKPGVVFSGEVLRAKDIIPNAKFAEGKSTVPLYAVGPIELVSKRVTK